MKSQYIIKSNIAIGQHYFVVCPLMGILNMVENTAWEFGFDKLSDVAELAAEEVCIWGQKKLRLFGWA